MKLINMIFLVYFAFVRSQTDFPTAGGLELDVVNAEKKNTTKTWGTLFPGTKWCGKGNKAKHEEDFGRYRATDVCCRSHDRCPDKIKSGMQNYGLQNNGSTTLLSCHCDESFYDCLKGVRSVTSKAVGVLYFDVLKPKCFVATLNDSGVYQWQHTRPFSQNKFIKFVSRHLRKLN